jgi:hypothetical protein
VTTPPAAGPAPGWHPQEVVPQAQDVLSRGCGRRCGAPSPAVRTAAAALALLLGGRPLPDHGGDADRRRFDRGVARLARPMRDRR